jgi:hypothetical protein
MTKPHDSGTCNTNHGIEWVDNSHNCTYRELEKWKVVMLHRCCNDFQRHHQPGHTSPASVTFGLPGRYCSVQKRLCPREIIVVVNSEAVR